MLSRLSHMLALMLAATACSSGPDPIERARLAAGRAPTSTLPEAPGQNQPFPNLGSVPARPETIAPEARRRLEDALVADRANARYVGQPVVPTVPPTSVSAPPRPEGPAVQSVFSMRTRPGSSEGRRRKPSCCARCSICVFSCSTSP